MKILIDVDGTTYDFISNFLDHLYVHNVLQTPMLASEIQCYNLVSALNIDPATLAKHLRLFGEEAPGWYRDNEGFGCGKWVRQLISDNNWVEFVTAKPNVARIHFDTKRWLKANFSVCSPHILDLDEGGWQQRCWLYAKSDVVIDDCPRNVCAASAIGTFTFLLDQPWNQSLDTGYVSNLLQSHLVRVRTWSEIYDQIAEIKAKNFNKRWHSYPQIAKGERLR